MISLDLRKSGIPVNEKDEKEIDEALNYLYGSDVESLKNEDIFFIPRDIYAENMYNYEMYANIDEDENCNLRKMRALLTNRLYIIEGFLEHITTCEPACVFLHVFPSAEVCHIRSGACDGSHQFYSHKVIYMGVDLDDFATLDTINVILFKSGQKLNADQTDLDKLHYNLYYAQALTLHTESLNGIYHKPAIEKV